MDSNSVLSILDLSDNQLHAECGRALARALRSSKSLLSLNLRLNRLVDDGCRALFDALKSANAAPLERLNVSGNGAGPAAVPALAGMLRANHTLCELDVGCNALGPAAGPDIKAALKDNTSLTSFDMRQCGLEANDEVAVSEDLLARLEKKERGKVLTQHGGAGGKM